MKFNASSRKFVTNTSVCGFCSKMNLFDVLTKSHLAFSMDVDEKIQNLELSVIPQFAFYFLNLNRLQFNVMM